MPVIKELIRTQKDGTISFGDYTLDTKSKVADFKHDGDIYKVKTFSEITKLEKNGMFVYESVPGTAVNNLLVEEDKMEFVVEGQEDAQITVELDNDTEYIIYINDANVGKMMTNLSGKLILSVELNNLEAVSVKIIKA